MFHYRPHVDSFSIMKDVPTNRHGVLLPFLFSSWTTAWHVELLAQFLGVAGLFFFMFNLAGLHRYLCLFRGSAELERVELPDV